MVFDSVERYTIKIMVSLHLSTVCLLAVTAVVVTGLPAKKLEISGTTTALVSTVTKQLILIQFVIYLIQNY